MTPPRVAMILAAGRGERMMPLTGARAKPTLPILGTPLLVRAARALANVGVRDVCVNAWHAPESVEDALASHDLGGARSSLFVESRLMGSGGAFAAPAERLAGEELFAAVNADTLLAPPLERLAAEALRNDARIGALLVRPGRTPDYGAVAVVGDTFRGIVRDDAALAADARAATYLGVAVFRRTLLDGVRRDAPSHLFADVVMPRLAKGRELAVVPYDGPWLEFTSAASYRDTLVRLVQAGRAAGVVPLPGGDAPVRSMPGGALFAAEDAVVEEGAMLTGGVILERGARAARGAMLENSVVLEGSHISAGASLARAVVADGVRVPRDSAVRHDVRVGGEAVEGTPA